MVGRLPERDCICPNGPAKVWNRGSLGPQVPLNRAERRLVAKGKRPLGCFLIDRHADECNEAYNVKAQTGALVDG